VQVLFSGRQGLRMVFFNPNCAKAFDTEGSEPYALLRLLRRKGYLTVPVFILPPWRTC
jgi:hypothetical protein